MARPSGLVASRSMRPLRTSAGPPVMVSSTQDSVGLRCPGPSAAAARAHDLAGAVGGLGEVEQVGAFGVVEAAGPGRWRRAPTR